MLIVGLIDSEVKKNKIIGIYYAYFYSKHEDIKKYLKSAEFEILIRFAMISSLITPHAVTGQGLKQLQT